LRHARALYDELKSRAKPEPNGDELAEVYMTSLYEELGISPNYRVAVRKILFDSNPPCAIKVVQGAGGRPTLVYLLREPNLSDLTGEDTSGRLSAGQISEKLKRLEAWRLSLAGLNIVEALRNHESRLAELEAQVATVATNEERDTNGTDKAQGGKPR